MTKNQYDTLYRAIEHKVDFFLNKCFAVDKDGRTIEYFISRLRKEVSDFVDQFEVSKRSGLGSYESAINSLEFVLTELLSILSMEFDGVSASTDIGFLEDYARHAYKDREKDFTLQRGERILDVDDGVKLYETVSSTNDNLTLQSSGSFYITNQRFVYLSNKGLSTFPFAKIEKIIDQRYAEGSRGRVCLSIAGRARKVCFITEANTDSLLYYSYFMNEEYRTAAHNMVASSLDRTKVGEYYRARFSLTRDSIEKVLKRGLQQAKSEELSVGHSYSSNYAASANKTGCCVPLILIVGVILLIIVA